MKSEIKLGFQDYTALVFIPDPASTDGSGKTGLVAANLTVSYTRVETDNDVTVTDVTSSLNNLAALTTAHTDWGLLEVSSTLAPGLYRLDIADAVFAAGAWTAVVYVMITTSAAAASPMEFILVAFDPLDTVRLGLTALPNAAAEAAGGFYTRGTGAGQINQAANGMIDTNPVRLNNVSQSLLDLKDFADDGYDPATNKVQGVVLTDTLTTYTGNTPQTGDVFPLASTEIADIKAKTDQLTFTTANKLDATIQAAGDFAQAAADKVWASATRTLSAFGFSVTVGTNSDKTGYTLSSAGVQAIWDALTSALTTVGSIGKLLVDNLDATISSRLATAGYTAPPTAAANADAVWDETLSGHLGAGSTGEALNGAGSAGDPWTTALPGAYGAGSAGNIIGNNVNATISSRASQTSLDTVDNLIDTEIADIQARLPAALVGGRMDSNVQAMAAGVITAAVVATDAIDSDAMAANAITEIQNGLATAAALATVSGFVDTEIATLQADVSAILADTGTDGVVVATASKTGYALSAAGVDEIFDELRAGHNVVGSYGESFFTLESGAAIAGTLSTTQMSTNLTETTDDHFNGRIIIFTSGALLRQATDITAYNGTTKVPTFTALTEAPVAGDKFVIV